MANLAIKGHSTRGSEVIELLEMLGGVNEKKLTGCCEDKCYWFGTNERMIVAVYPLTNWTVFTLEEFLEKFPYKVGDKVLVKGYDSPVNILLMTWNGSEIEYRINTEGDWLTADELQPYKEETMEGVYYNGEINCYHQDFEDKVRIRLGGDFEIKVEDGKTYVVRKKPKYPKSYKECCDALGLCTMDNDAKGYKSILIIRFQELLIARDAYWKIAGD